MGQDILLRKMLFSVTMITLKVVLRLHLKKKMCNLLFCCTVKPVLETTCIKRPPALRDHCSDIKALLKST